jgi:lysozyme
MTPEVYGKLVNSIEGHEGLMLRVYDDATGRVVQPGGFVKGWLTIGYGRNLVGRGITRQEADYLLANDIDAVERELDQHFPVWRMWSDARQWAIAELTFNLGVSRFAAKWPNTAAALRLGQFETVAETLKGSLWRQQVGEGRAVPIINALRTGVWA